MASPLARHWRLDPAIDFLNHGSYGACPEPVLAAQTAWRARIERDPVRFLALEFEGLLAEARETIAAFLGCDGDDLVFTANATSGVNTVLASLPLAAGDEIVVTSHGYNACRNAAERWAARAGARVVEAALPFPIADADAVVAAVLGALSAKTRLLLIDHVTSPTALILPLPALLAEVQRRGIAVLVDGAHGAGMLPLALDTLGADYYAGTFHKWCCAPRGVGFLHVRRDRQAGLRPLVTSHGANSARRDRSRFLLEFDWTGTADPSGLLSVPAALEFLSGLFPGGFAELRAAQRALILAARARLLTALGIGAPCPEAMLGSMATLPLPERAAPERRDTGVFVEPLYSALLERHRIQVVALPWPALPRRILRISAHAYNDLAQYERLAEALASELAHGA